MGCHFQAYPVEDPTGDLVGFECDQCAPSGALPLDYGETDCPAHCECGRPLEHELTDEGVRYVIEAVGELMALADDEWADPSYLKNEPPYYLGSPRFSVVEDWAEDLHSYNLDGADGDKIEAFLDRCARVRATMVRSSPDGSASHGPMCEPRG